MQKWNGNSPWRDALFEIRIRARELKQCDTPIFYLTRFAYWQTLVLLNLGFPRRPKTIPCQVQFNTACISMGKCLLKYSTFPAKPTSFIFVIDTPTSLRRESTPCKCFHDVASPFGIYNCGHTRSTTYSRRPPALWHANGDEVWKAKTLNRSNYRY